MNQVYEIWIQQYKCDPLYLGTYRLNEASEPDSTEWIWMGAIGFPDQWELPDRISNSYLLLPQEGKKIFEEKRIAHICSHLEIWEPNALDRLRDSESSIRTLVVRASR